MVSKSVQLDQVEKMQTILRICINLFRALDGLVTLITHQILPDVLSVRYDTSNKQHLPVTEFTCVKKKIGHPAL